MENPLPKNWNQDLVLTMPECEGFAEVEEWASRICSGGKEMRKSKVNL